MGPAQWKRIQELFDSAHDLEADDLFEFLNGRCGGDEELRAEVLRLLKLDQQAASFMESPAFRILPPTVDVLTVFHPGTVAADRFRIERLLGRGGMGEVYEAYDLVLKDYVAVKVMRPNFDTASNMAARFVREVQLARRIAHPGVCRVHDAVLHRTTTGSDVVVVTMELLRGETLAARIAGGPMPIDEVLEIGKQLAEALDAAHAAGVLHRDIKPTNIFLERGSDGGMRAVLTDFGLARALCEDEHDTMTHSGVLIGTPEYLSPEQMRGDAPTKRSDTYALALVLYEMTMAVRPFSGRTSVERMLKRLTEAPRSSAGFVPNAARCDAVFKRALNADLHRRYDSAAELIKALSGATRRRGWNRPRIRPLASTAAAVVMFVALFIAGFRLYNRGRPEVSPASEIVLTEMVNGTGDAAFDGATEVLRSQLSQSPHFDLVSSERTDEILREMRQKPGTRLEPEIAREVALREGAPLVLYSTISRLGPQYTFSVRLEHVGSRPALTRSIWTREFQANSRADVFAAVHDASNWIRTTIGERSEELNQQDRSPADTTTSSWDALRLFATANLKDRTGDASGAVLMLQEALRLDADFAMARMRLADILISLHRDADGYEQWRDAIELTTKHGLTSRENLRIQAQYAEDTGDLPGAERAYRAYVLHYPNDFLPAFLLGSILSDLGRTAEATHWFEKATALQPRGYTAQTHLTIAYLDLGDFKRAAAVINDLNNRGFRDWAVWLSGVVGFLKGGPTEALATIAPLHSSSDVLWKSRAFSIRGGWLTEAGRYAEAASELNAGIGFDERNGLRDREADKWLYLAEIALRTGRIDEMAPAVSKAMDIAPNPNRAMRAGTILVRVRNIGRAKQLLRYFRGEPDLPRVQVAAKRLAGEIALALGQNHQAVQLMRESAALAPVRFSQAALVHALIASRDFNSAEHILNEALEHPARIWAAPEPEYPGVWADILNEHDQVVNLRKRQTQ